MTPHEVLAEELGLFARGVKAEVIGSCRIAVAETKVALAEVRQQLHEIVRLRDELLSLRPFTVRGTWSKETNYRTLDVVALDGASFVARRDNPGTCPGDGWQLIAAQGKRGHPGGQGERGPKGPPGPSVAALTVDEQGLLTLTNGDGSTVTCDLYPLLAKLAR